MRGDTRISDDYGAVGAAAEEDVPGIGKPDGLHFCAIDDEEPDTLDARGSERCRRTAIVAFQ